ncbi:hypothetical protein Acor_22630 [Acrocarpospora corrugata]|uniref:Uncharacterized protein n=1 Tax=Acrocarpospora corrugata TaxID=35763 RepID=A0A5M3VW66_9ACTN|nr:hypothetical protein Acor_22630 [Acrocarpospora corrugata]
MTAALAGMATETPMAPNRAVNDNKTGKIGKRLAITSLSTGGPKRNQSPPTQAIDRPPELRRPGLLTGSARKFQRSH